MSEQRVGQAGQRWVRPLDVAPGHWKKQLATKYLAVAAKGEVSALAELLQDHPEFLNKRGNHGRTLLWEAVRAGRLGAVELLVGRGADVELTGCLNSETLVQISPFCAAAYYRRTEVAALLEPRVSPPDIFQAAFLGNVACVEQLLAAEPELLHAEDSDNEIYFTPPLTFAVAGGSRSVVELLLDAGAKTPTYSAQLLHVASALGEIELLNLLCSRGVDPTAADASVFLIARTMETVRWLIDRGVPVDQVGMSGFPPIVYLARGDKGNTLDRIAELLRRGASIDAKGPLGRTALHYAAAGGADAKAQFLLSHGANRLALDDTGKTPFDLALAAGKASMADLLR